MNRAPLRLAPATVHVDRRDHHIYLRSPEKLAPTARCVTESLAGEEPVSLPRLLPTEATPLDESTAAIRSALRGDCHAHSDWSDGVSPIA